MLDFDKKLPVVLVDLDGTMFSNLHRSHLIPPRNLWREPAAWHGYDFAAKDDTPVAHFQDMVISLWNSGDYNIAFCTARFRTSFAPTFTQLRAHGLYWDKRCDLFMRPTENVGSPAAYKVGVVEKLRAEGFRVAFALDDSPQVIRALREAGVPVLPVESQCGATRIEMEDEAHTLAEEKGAHRQTKEKLGRTLERNASLAAEVDRLRHELEGRRDADLNTEQGGFAEVYYLLREELQIPPHYPLVDYVTNMREQIQKLTEEKSDV